jgi:ATP-dependent Lhr-like helicase
MVSSTALDALGMFAEPTRAWFGAAFGAPTAAQAGAWEAIAEGAHTLVVAPTGSGKTLAAFLWGLDRLSQPDPPSHTDADRTQATPPPATRVLYVSPLKALAVDVERNLRSPLVGIAQTATRLGLPHRVVSVGIRSGDTPPDERRRLARRPPDVLITTPESLYLMLTSSVRDTLRGVDTVIVDEIHAVAGTKRGAHLALSLERLDALLPRPAQRIGLSATVRPVQEVARFLAAGRPVTQVTPPSDKVFELSVEVPVDDMADLAASAPASAGQGPEAAPRASIWPHVEERVLELINQHRSTIVFANSRRLAERLTARLNEAAAERAGLEAGPEGPPAQDAGRAARVPAEVAGASGSTRGAPGTVGTHIVARAHHGSVSKEQRAQIEDALKRGDLPAVVATSSLELGIDMGAVDLVVQVESPPSVAGGLQRIGRAGHQVGAVSRGVLLPKYRGDLVQTAVVTQRMDAGLIEATRVPRNPLDVLAQQVVAMVAVDDWSVGELLALVRRAAPYTDLPWSSFEAVLDMLSGRYPSDEFAELRPRLVWDRTTDVLSARPGAQRLAVTSGGTIPDRGLFGVHVVGERASKVGELDEEMVYESRVGDVFALGASSWRIEDITHDRVVVSPAPGQPGRLPFWRGDSLGRPAELGEAVGAFVRRLSALPDADALSAARGHGLDERAAGNLVAYLREQRDATGVLPDDRTLLVERFRDELGDWRLVVHSPFGAGVNGPWALAVAAVLRARYGADVHAAHADDGMVFRIPDTVGLVDLVDQGEGPSGDPDPAATLAGVLDAVLLDPDDVEALVTAEVGGSALYASRFRECASRALLLPRRDPRRRTPLWQQRQRSAQLLEVAAKHATFPILLETMRECLQDVYDLPALVAVLRRLAERQIRVVEVETAQPSPFATSLLFGYVAAFLYEGDAPLAERRAQALTLDATLLAELLGRAELRDLLDEEAVLRTEAELQRLAPDRRVRGTEGVADLLRVVGPLTTEEVAARLADAWPNQAAASSRPPSAGTASAALHELGAARRAVEVRMGGEPRWTVVEDVARLRDALGVAVPPGVPPTLLEAVPDPLGDLVSRYARTHGPFAADEVAGRLGLGVSVVRDVLHRLAADGRVTEGEFRPGRSGTEWCDVGVLRLVRRRSLARLRAEIEPVDPVALARFLPAWQGVGAGSRGPDAVLAVVEQLAGALVPASALESVVLPSRVNGYQPGWLDELTTDGSVLWVGAGALPGNDGRVSLVLADEAALTMPAPPQTTLLPVQQVMLAELSRAGGLFFRQLVEAVRADETLTAASLPLLERAVWDLAWAGLVTNDTLGPLRATITARGRPSASVRGARPSTRRPGRAGALRAARMAALPTPPTVAGRWSRLPTPDEDPTRRAHALAGVLLDRYGVLTRGSVQAERFPGGFAAAYRVLSALEEAGQCRRGYVVEGLGAAQFAVPGAIDRIRATTTGKRHDPSTLLLAAADPANAYGAGLPWPETGGPHRPGRKAGALVVLHDGALVLYVERGGRSLLTFTDDETALVAAAQRLAEGVQAGALGRLTVQRADGASVVHSRVGDALTAAGFVLTPRGLRLRRR